MGGTNNLAEAEFGVDELPTDKVGASVSRMGAVRSGVRDNRVRGRVLEGEEGIGEEIQGVGYASGPCLGDEHVMAAMVRQSGGYPKTADTMMSP